MHFQQENSLSPQISAATSIHCFIDCVNTTLVSPRQVLLRAFSPKNFANVNAAKTKECENAL